MSLPTGCGGGQAARESAARTVLPTCPIQVTTGGASPTSAVSRPGGGGGRGGGGGARGGEGAAGAARWRAVPKGPVSSPLAGHVIS
ncbi:hypothetical protein, partial [Nocardia asiatica]|uniref:hypothetical protein n=1 Tax=Nocardia asiatica TaxID=209252 RepID=UPI002458FB6A